MHLPDMRGKHKAYPCIQDSKILLVMEHIPSFHTVLSHYSRKHLSNARYLEANVEIKLAGPLGQSTSAQSMFWYGRCLRHLVECRSQGLWKIAMSNLAK